MQQRQLDLVYDLKGSDPFMRDKSDDIKRKFEGIRAQVQKNKEVQSNQGIQSSLFLRCQATEKTLRFPVYFKDCLSNINHRGQCFDLFGIFEKLDKGEAVQCKWCKKGIKQEELKTKLFRSMLHEEALFTFHSSTNEIQYLLQDHMQVEVGEYRSKQYLFHQKYSSGRYTDLQNNQQLVKDMVKKGEKKEYNFTTLLQGQVGQQNLEFRVLCAFSQCKPNIPVRHMNCKHMEVFEITSLFIAMRDIKKAIECPVTGCSTKMDLTKIQEEFFIDFELLNAIRQGLPFSFIFKYDPGNYKLNDKLLKEQDHFLIRFQELRNPLQSLEKYKEEVGRLTDIAFKNNAEVKEYIAIMKKFRYQDYRFPIIDPITNQKIEIPSRCKRCPTRTNVMELRIFFSLIKEYVDKANKFVDETGGIVEKFKCPLCQKNFVNDFDSAVSTEVYIDFEILEKMSVEYVKYMKQDYLEMSGKERTRVVFQKKQKITSADYLILPDVEASQAIQYRSIFCCLSRTKLKTPLYHQKCKHRVYFDFDVYFDMFKAVGYDFSKVQKTCIQCTVPITDFSDLVLDEVLQNLLKKQLANQYQDTGLKLNLRERKLEKLNMMEASQILQAQPQVQFDSSNFAYEGGEYSELFNVDEYHGFKMKVVEMEVNGIVFKKDGFDARKFLEEKKKIDEKHPGFRCVGFEDKQHKVKIDNFDQLVNNRVF